MADVSVDGSELRIALTIPERVLSLHAGEVRIPLESIVSARSVKDVMGQLRGLRRPGVGVPGVLAIGTWRGTDDGVHYQDFVVVSRSGPGVVITLTGGPYDRVLLGTENPRTLIATLAK